MILKCILILEMAVIAFPVMAEDVINPDRPGFADGTKVVGRDKYQLEMGLQYARNNEGGLSMYDMSTPTLFRIGVNDILELRIASDGVMKQSQTFQNLKQVTNGIGDSSLGMKWHVMDANEAQGIPNIALIANVDFATGSKAFRGDGSRPSVRAVSEWALTDSLTFGALAGVYSEKNSLGKKYTSTMLSASMSGSINNQWGGFVDVAGEKLTTKSGGDKVVTLGVGVTYLLNQDMQLDLFVIKGLTDVAPKIQVGAGLSVRF